MSLFSTQLNKMRNTPVKKSHKKNSLQERVFLLNRIELLFYLKDALEPPEANIASILDF
jgi:hypothetical protein